MGYGKSERDEKVGTAVPGYTPELGTRLSSVIDALGGLQAASTIVGVTDEQISKWRSGKARAPFFALAELASAAGMSLDWLATGEGPMRRQPDIVAETPDGQRLEIEVKPTQMPADEELMARLVDGIMAVYKREGVGLPPRDLGRLAARMHADLVAGYDDPDERKIAVKAMLLQLARDLREAPIGADSKRRA